MSIGLLMNAILRFFVVLYRILWDYPRYWKRDDWSWNDMSKFYQRGYWIRRKHCEWLSEKQRRTKW